MPKLKYDYHIRVPQWGAGTTYRWDEEQYGIRGIGIARHRLKAKMILKVGGDIYETSSQDIVDFINKYPRSRTSIKGMDLYIFPLRIMKLIQAAPVKKFKPKKKVPPPEPDQKSLF